MNKRVNEKKITIELIFDHLPSSEKLLISDPCSKSNNNRPIIRRRVDVAADTDIAEILPSFSAKGLALWHDNTYGGRIIVWAMGSNLYFLHKHNDESYELEDANGANAD